MLSGLSDVVVGAIRRNTATSQSSSGDGEAVTDTEKTLEKSMEKVITHLAMLLTIMINYHSQTFFFLYVLVINII